MRFNIGDKVIIKNRRKIKDNNNEHIVKAIYTKKEFIVKRAIPMKGYYIESDDGLGGILNSCDLRLVIEQDI